ncbi:hypothetical protein KR222_006302, partial [Zaprionus bogoriensis]
PMIRGFRTMIMGPPGSGKGHISEQIMRVYGAVHIAAGDILRKHIQRKTKLGKVAEQYTSKGRLVPDHLLQGIIAMAIYKAGKSNFILDGYPRTLAQAQHLDSLVNLDFVVNLQIADEAIVDMLRNRMVHVPSGRVYNAAAKAPKTAGLDDITGERLQRRADDHPRVVKIRLESSQDQMWPVLRHYQKQYKLITFRGRQHQSLWPQVQKYMNRRLNK